MYHWRYLFRTSEGNKNCSLESVFAMWNCRWKFDQRVYHPSESCRDHTLIIIDFSHSARILDGSGHLEFAPFYLAYS